MSFDQNKTKISLILSIITIFVVISIFYFKFKEFNEPVLTEVGETELATYLTLMTESDMAHAVPSNLIATNTATTTIPAKGSYSTYSDSKLTSLEDDVKIVLFFNAAWSPESESVDRELVQAVIPPNVIILVVDYDKYTDLRKKYSVTAPRTFIRIDASGNFIKKWNSESLETIFKELK